MESFSGNFIVTCRKTISLNLTRKSIVSSLKQSFDALLGSSYLTKILRLIEEYGLRQNVELTGGLLDSELRKLYSACDIFVLPSLAESGPRVVLEAMACGKPVIGTKVGWVPMVVKDGQSGFLIDPADEQRIAERIRHLIDNPAEANASSHFGCLLAHILYSSETSN